MATLEEIEALLKDMEAGPGTAPEPETPFSGVGKWIGEKGKQAWEYVSGAGARRATEEGGIALEPAPAKARAMASLPPDKADQLIELSRQLDKQFGTEVPLKYSPEIDDLLYRHPEHGWSAVDLPGFEWADIADIAGEAPAAIGEAVGTLLGAGGKGKALRGLIRGARVLGAEALGAATGEYGRMKAAEETGALAHRPPEEIASMEKLEPAKAAGLSAAGGLGMRSLGIIGNKIMNYAKGTKLPSNFVELGLKVPEGTPPAINEVNRRLAAMGRPERYRPTTGELLDDEAAMAFEQELARSRIAGHTAAKGVKEEQAKATEGFLTGSGAQFRSQTSDQELRAGEQLKAAVEERLGKGEAVMKRQVAEASAEEEAARRAVAAQAGRAPTDVGLGASAREIPETLQSRFQDWAAKAYGDIAKEAGEFKFLPKNLMETASTQKQLFDKDWAQSLTTENRKLVNELTDRLMELRTTPTGGQYHTLGYGTFDQLQRFISQIKKAERAVDNGTLPGLDKKALRELRVAAMKDREERLARHSPELHQRLLDTEKEYAQRKQGLVSSVLGDLTKRVNGRLKIKDEQVFGKIFGPDKTHATSAEQFATVLKDPEFTGQLTEVKGAIYRKYLDDVEKNGIIDPKRHADWMEKHTQTLSKYFNPDELRTFAEAGRAGEKLAEYEAREKVFTQALKKATGHEFRSMHPADITDWVWQRPGRIMSTMKALKSSPEVLAAVQGAALQKVEAGIKRYDPLLGRDIVDFGALTNYLKNNRRQIKELFGPDYLKDLEILRDAVKIQRKSADAPSREVLGGMSGMRQAIFGAIFGPLSHTGYALRKFGKAKTAVEAENLAKVILDPEALHMVARANTSSDLSRAMQFLSGAYGLQYLSADTPTEASRPTTLDKLRGVVSGNPKLKEKLINVR